ncbi:MAG: Fe-S cluster assembly protein SufD [Chitinophagales bacterium]|nr:Fe-S cluster assembly protein SufD [Chitinophagales bacterium]
MNLATYSLKELFQEHLKCMNDLIEKPIYEIKIDAFNEFNRLGFPTLRSEEWRYTNVHSFTRASVNPLFYPETHEKIQKDQFHFFDTIKANKIVIINGSFQEHLSEILEDHSDVEIIPTAKAIADNHPVFFQHFSKSTTKQYANEFSSLNTAFFGDGVFIHVKENKSLKYPIMWIFLSDTNSDCIINPRNLIVLEKGSKATIIKDHQSIGVDYFINDVSEIQIKEYAQLNFFSLQNESTKGLHLVSSNFIDLGKEAKFKNLLVSLAGKLVRSNILCNLNEQGSHADIKGLYFGKGQDHFDHAILVRHMAANTESNQLFKGILDDESNGVFTGRIYVAEGADKTNAYQRNQNLMLSDEATFNSRPQLEIYADDVKCSHGATNGQIDQQALFYLKSRGIKDENAFSLLQYAYLSELINEIDEDDIRTYIDDLFIEKLSLSF